MQRDHLWKKVMTSFCQKIIFGATIFFLISSFFNLKIFSAFLVKVLNIVSFD